MTRWLRTNYKSILAALIISIPICIMAAKEQSKPEIMPMELIQEEAAVESSSFLPIYVQDITEASTEAEKESETEVETVQVEMVMHTYYDIPLSEEFQDAMKEICERHEMCFELVLAVANVESTFNVNAIGDHGEAIGLMQIQPKWWQKLMQDTGLDVYEPLGNVELAVIIINQFLESNDGDMRLALNQYNSGKPNNESNPYFDRVLESLDYLETVMYQVEKEGVVEDVE